MREDLEFRWTQQGFKKEKGGVIDFTQTKKEVSKQKPR